MKFTLQVVSLKTWRLIKKQVKKSCFIKARHWINTSIYRGLMKKLNTSSIYRDLWIQNSQIWISAHDDLDDWGFSFYNPRPYKRLILKSSMWHRDSIREFIYSMRSYCVLCALEFCNQMLPDLKRDLKWRTLQPITVN